MNKESEYTAENSFLSHAIQPKAPYRPKYYKKIKVPTQNDYRYFYSEREWQAYLKNQRSRKKDSSTDARPQWMKDRDEQKRRQNLEKEKFIQQQREQAIMETNAKFREQENARKEKEQREKMEALTAKWAQEEAKENAESEQRKKIAELNERKKLPESVSLNDYIFGGQIGKDMRASRKKLKATQKEIRKQMKELDSLNAKIEKMNAKSGSLSTRSKQKLKKLEEQRVELEAGLAANRRENAKNLQDYSVALTRYNGATLVGSISSGVKQRRQKVSRIIKKYSKMLFSKIPKVNIKLKK